MSTYDPQRHPAASMFERTVHEASEETGGRWKRNADVSIAGTGPIPHADKLAAPTWSTDVGPMEPPTGECIDAVGSMETLSGIDRAEALVIDAANAADADTPTDTEPTEP
jgi:hypothetical protein